MPIATKNTTSSPAGTVPDPSHVSPDILEALQQAIHGDPFAVLGMHQIGADVVMRAWLPGADAVELLDTRDRRVCALQRQGDSALHGAVVPRRRRPFRYRLRVRWAAGHVTVIDDPYGFGPLIEPTDLYLLAEGTHHRPYEWLGAHPQTFDGVEGTRFVVWAPAAQRVSVVGPFNQWDGRRHPMRRRHEGGFWELFLPAVRDGDLYKYEILGADGQVRLKADPYAFRAELRPDTASVVQRLLPGVASSTERQRANALDAPIAIYEVHLGSWRRHADRQWLTYRELAEHLVPYVRDLGFTHIELLPLHEHPFDGSWGYQPTGLYAPTARYGTPEDLRAFIDAAHGAGLGVILDWVPAHFPTDAFALADFDGTHLYEHADPREGFHQDWNTLIYNVGRIEVRNFLAGNALYWIERFGIDGLRVDAVASMLYLDYSRKPGEWLPNRHGGRENLEAIDFLKSLNVAIGHYHPGAMTIAEESTAFPGVTRPVHEGGLGFHFKWNMGWMNDTLRYAALDPVHRRYHHRLVTFSFMYAWSEKFLLPVSHDEVVHGKHSLLDKMPGDEWQKRANYRLFRAYTMAHPGKKLLFMGSEFGQWHEWRDHESLDWSLLATPAHRGLVDLNRDLNRMYSDLAALHAGDADPAGFAWIDVDSADQSVFAFLRRDPSRPESPPVVCVFNATPVPRDDYWIGVPEGGRYRKILDTDSPRYGGSGYDSIDARVAEAQGSHGYPYRLRLRLPPLAALWFQVQR